MRSHQLPRRRVVFCFGYTCTEAEYAFLLPALLREWSIVETTRANDWWTTAWLNYISMTRLELVTFRWIHCTCKCNCRLAYACEWYRRGDRIEDDCYWRAWFIYSFDYCCERDREHYSMHRQRNASLCSTLGHVYFTNALGHSVKTFFSFHFTLLWYESLAMSLITRVAYLTFYVFPYNDHCKRFIWMRRNICIYKNNCIIRNKE